MGELKSPAMVSGPSVGFTGQPWSLILDIGPELWHGLCLLDGCKPLAASHSLV